MLKQKPIKERVKVRLSKYFQEFKDGDRVLLDAEPAVQRGMYFPRFHNEMGIVKGKKGRCYEVMIKDGKKEKLN